jgi:2-iminobutanoate/2-iminopropanoate deaminase
MNKTILFILGALAVAVVLIGFAAVNEMSSKKVIATEDAPDAIGPYSQGILVGDTLYCSGQIPLDPATGELVNGTIEAQTRQVLDNLGAVLKAAGMDYGDVVSVTIFMDDMDNFARINQVCAEYFKVDEQPPARCTVEAARLPKDARVEISLIAIKTR